MAPFRTFLYRLRQRGRGGSQHFGICKESKRPASSRALCANVFQLPVHFHRKLELPWIVSRRSQPGVGEKWTDRRHIHFVSNIEHVGDQVDVDALCEIDAPGDTKIVKNCPGLNRRVASEIAIQGQKSDRREYSLACRGRLELLITGL